MNGTVGRGSKVHATNGSYANCGKGAGRNAVTATKAPVDCLACLALPTAETTAPATHTYEVTYRKNTLGRGWVTKTARHTTTEAGMKTIAANMIRSASFELISSTRV